jgi:hypothetical protein
MNANSIKGVNMVRDDIPGAYTIARECLDSAKGDAVRAARLMRDRVKNDPVLAPALIEIACKECISQVRLNNNRVAWEAAMPPVTRHTFSNGHHRIKALVRETALSIMDTELPNHKRLGDASAADLDFAIDHYGKSLRTMSHKVRFWTLIRKKIGGSVVEKVFKEKDLIKLKKEAEHE